MSGHGKKFDFHGKFASKTMARRKERQLRRDGEKAFVIKVRSNYYVVTKRSEGSKKNGHESYRR